jgi:hypothetical protein
MLSTRQCNDATDSLSGRPPPQCGAMHEAKRILMVDLTTTQLHAKGAATPAGYEGGPAEAAHSHAHERATTALHQQGK